MTPPLTSEMLDEIEARTAKVPDGPWYAEHSEWADGGVKLKARGVRLFPLGRVPTGCGGLHADTNYPDGTPEGDNATNVIEFVVHAREDIPALCAAVRQLMTKVETLEIRLGEPNRRAEQIAMEGVKRGIRQREVTAVANFRERAVLMCRQRAGACSGEDTEEIQRAKSTTYRIVANVIAALPETGETRDE